MQETPTPTSFWPSGKNPRAPLASRPVIWLIPILAALTVLAGCAHGGRVERDVVYTPPGWPQALGADIHRPARPGPHPAVLLVHGGGWEGRSRADMEGIAERLAERGFVAMNVSYRFAPAHRFPAQLHDLEQALAWLRSAAPRYDVDPRRVGAYGYSAGGHLVALLGTMGENDSRLQAVVAGAAPTDLRKIGGGGPVPRLLGATLKERPELFSLASPITHAGKGDAPMFLYHGAGDLLVAPSHARELKRALDAAGVRAELRIVPVLGHFLTFLLARGAEGEAIDFLDETLRP